MPALDPQLRRLLTSLRGRVRRYIVADAVLAMVACLLSAFWIGMLIDFLPVRLGGTEMPRSARSVLLLAVGGLAVWLFAKLLVARLRRPLPDDSLALLVERHHPALGGRLVTAVQLQRDGRTGDAHAPDLLSRVHAEAAAAVGGVDSNRIFRWRPLLQKVWVVVPLVVATTLLAALAPSAFARAAGRLLLLTDAPWPRQASLEMVGVELPAVSADEADAPPPKLIEFSDRVMRLPRGSSGTLRVLARADDAVVPDLCTVHFETAAGIRGQANMRRVGRVNDGYQAFVLDGPPLAGLSESFSLSVRGLDARLDRYRIEAVEPPALSRLQVVTTDPAYLWPAADDETPVTSPPRRKVDYQSGLRVREGARAELTARSSVPLDRVDARMLVAGNVVQTPAVELSDDGTEFSLVIEDMRQPATLVVVPEDRDGITAQVPYRYFLGVVADEQPEIETRFRGIGTAVTRNARIPIVGRAVDDYGIASASITLGAIPETADQPEVEGAMPAESAVPATINLPIRPDRNGDFELTIDLRELDAAKPPVISIPEPGGAINLIGEVTDHYDLDGQSHRVTGQLYRLEIVTPETLLSLLERRELALRARLEQTIEETRLMRDSLVGIEPELAFPPRPDNAESTPDDAAGEETASEETTVEEATVTEDTDGETSGQDDPSAESDRQRQILRLRTQQIGLQASKTAEELAGIATSLDDLLDEMANNRVDSVDRSERIGGGVRDPLREIIAGDLARLRTEIDLIRRRIPASEGAGGNGGQTTSPDESDESAGSDGSETTATAQQAAGEAVQTAEQVLLQLTAILEKMLDLESYNEILDMVRELIESQDGLIEETKKEQKRSVLDLFE